MLPVICSVSIIFPNDFVAYLINYEVEHLTSQGRTVRIYVCNEKKNKMFFTTDLLILEMLVAI